MPLSEYQQKLNRIKLGIESKTTGPKPKKQLKRQSDKKIAELAQEKAERGSEDTYLVKWFKARIKQLTGRCAECGGSVETKVYKYAILSVCHLLAKRETMCPSVQFHPLNFIELCPHHHDQLDKSNWEEIELWGCWPVIQERLVMIYPDLAVSERRHFPESVLRYMQKNEPF